MLLHLQISSFRPHTDSRYYLTAKPQVVYRTSFLLYIHICCHLICIFVDLRFPSASCHTIFTFFLFSTSSAFIIDFPLILLVSRKPIDGPIIVSSHCSILKISAECLYIIQHLSSGVQFHLRKFLTAKPGRHNTWK